MDNLYLPFAEGQNKRNNVSFVSFRSPCGRSVAEILLQALCEAHGWKRLNRAPHDGWPSCVTKIWRERYDNSKEGSRRGARRERQNAAKEGSARRLMLKQCGLHRAREPANFCVSHRCTSDVRLWSGARRCFDTCASRFLVLLAFSRTLLALLGPSVGDLWEKLPNSINVRRTPETNTDTTYLLDLWSGYFLRQNISMQCNEMNSKQLRCISCRLQITAANDH